MTPRSLRRRVAGMLLATTGLPGCGDGARLWITDLSTRLRQPDVPSVDVAEGRRLVEQGAVWVDVRTEPERGVSRIPGAIDAEAVEASPSQWTDQVLIAYCTIGVRSADWAAARRAEGLDVRNLKGSVMAWARAGLDFEGPSGAPTREVHTWSEDFDWLPDGYQGVTQPPVP